MKQQYWSPSLQCWVHASLLVEHWPVGKGIACAHEFFGPVAQTLSQIVTALHKNK